VSTNRILVGPSVALKLAPAMQELYSRHVGPDWADNLHDPKMWARIDSVYDAEPWETHRTLKATLVNFVAGVGEDAREGG
jgi:hypothetical protein